MTSGLETEQVYSYNPEARTGPVFECAMNVACDIVTTTTMPAGACLQVNLCRPVSHRLYQFQVHWSAKNQFTSAMARMLDDRCSCLRAPLCTGRPSLCRFIKTYGETLNHYDEVSQRYLEHQLAVCKCSYNTLQ